MQPATRTPQPAEGAATQTSQPASAEPSATRHLQPATAEGTPLHPTFTSGTGEVLIRCENLGKKFCRDLKKSLWYGVKDSAADLFGWSRNTTSATPNSVLRPGEFWANKDISIELKRGECVGLIGRNGAGKTTLLKMINGLIRPDAGLIRIHGTVSGLIALGAGFNPVLTGRENILVNGAILGLSRRQINNRIEKIVDFAELSDAIDSPVRTYSSGMQVRLGFAAAANLIQPDVLLLDEVLAVGDIGFTIKCLNAMRKLTNQSAVMFVTHSMQFVSTFCTHAMLMQHGRSLMCSRDIGLIIDHYHRSFSLDGSYSGTGEAKILKLELLAPGTDSAPTEHIAVAHGTRVLLRIELETQRPAGIKVFLMSQNLIPLLASDIVDAEGSPEFLLPGRRTIVVDLGVIDFNAGLYPIVIAVRNRDTMETLLRLESAASIRVFKDGVDWGFVSRKFNVIPDQDISNMSFKAPV